MERAVFVYTTWPTTAEAEAAGRSLVERRLAACVNILPGMISHYRWEGKVERAEEAVMIVKTRHCLICSHDLEISNIKIKNNLQPETT